MIANIWNFITLQFRFSQDGVSQSWLLWTLILVGVLLKNSLKARLQKK